MSWSHLCFWTAFLLVGIQLAPREPSPVSAKAESPASASVLDEAAARRRQEAAYAARDAQLTPQERAELALREAYILERHFPGRSDR